MTEIPADVPPKRRTRREVSTRQKMIRRRDRRRARPTEAAVAAEIAERLIAYVRGPEKLIKRGAPAALKGSLDILGDAIGRMWIKTKPDHRNAIVRRWVADLFIALEGALHDKS